MDFTEEQIERYSRHIILPEVGGLGQAKIREASCFIIGAGGLGAPAAMYLAAAGIGRLGTPLQPKKAKAGGKVKS